MPGSSLSNVSAKPRVGPNRQNQLRSVWTRQPTIGSRLLQTNPLWYIRPTLMERMAIWWIVRQFKRRIAGLIAAEKGSHKPAKPGSVSKLWRAMSTEKQRAAAKKNIKKAATAAKSQKTISHLPAKTRTALGKKGAEAAKKAG
jgi:hypothetical protein